MAPHDDPDPEPPATTPPLPPEDRLWRHPSELGPWAAGRLTAEQATGQRATPDPTPRRSVVAGVCLAGLFVAIGGLWLSRPGVEPTEVASPRTTTSIAATSLVTPVAVAASPMSRRTTVDPGPDRPGRLAVEIGDVDGAVVVSVSPDGAAAHAGIAPGDRIVAVDGRLVAHSTALLQGLARTRPGQTVEVIVHRSGDLVRLTVTLE